MERLIGNIVSGLARVDPGRTAATLDKREMTFGEVDLAANRLATALRRRKIVRGDLVAWWSNPSLETVVVMIACARLGAVFAPLSPLLGDPEVGQALDYIEPAVLIADPNLVGRAGDGVTIEEVVHGAGTDPVDESGLRDSDPHILYLTSGSTGRPKGVLVSHRASWMRSWRGVGGYGKAIDGFLVPFPLFHYAGWHFVLEGWLNGSGAHLVGRASGAEIASAIERHRPTATYCIPAVWERLLAEPVDLGHFRIADTGTSTVSADLVARMREAMPKARTTISYGASEAGQICILEDAEIEAHPGSVGRPLAQGRMRIAEDGEILFSGPTLMDGYLNMPEETARAVDDGWYHTGDLGSQDDEGFVHITGRIREVIRSGGETISPSEIEGALGSLPGVSELAIIGVPDPTWGEVVCAVVVPARGSDAPTVADLRDRLGNLAPYKHPRSVVIAEEIPRTAATGQVRRAALREELLAARPCREGASAGTRMT